MGVSDRHGHLERRGTTEAPPMWKNGSQGFVLQFSSTIFTVYNLKSNEHSAEGKADFYAIKQILISCRIPSYIVFFSASLFSLATLPTLSPSPGCLGILHNLFLGCMSSSGAYKIFIRFQKYLHPAVKRG